MLWQPDPKNASCPKFIPITTQNKEKFVTYCYCLIWKSPPSLSYLIRKHLTSQIKDMPYGLSPLTNGWSWMLRDDGWLGWIFCFSQSMWRVDWWLVDDHGCLWTSSWISWSSSWTFQMELKFYFCPVDAQGQCRWNPCPWVTNNHPTTIQQPSTSDQQLSMSIHVDTSC